MQEGTISVQNVLTALDEITGGRLATPGKTTQETNPYVVTKDSHIPGKAIVELPGLVYGQRDQSVGKLGIVMTVTETVLELAHACDLDLLITHHPVADAASCGGVPLKTYLDLYNLSLVELHEAAHGLHPGMAWLHGHQPYRVDVAYGGVLGNVLFVGQPLPGIRTLGDALRRLYGYLSLREETQLLEAEMKVRGVAVSETVVACRPQILLGDRERPVRELAHIFPHTGFSVEHLDQVVAEHPQVDTLLVSISRIPQGSALLARAKELNLGVLIGNSHALEILENGLPLAFALEAYFPQVEIIIFRERVTATNLAKCGSGQIQAYGREVAQKFLLPGSGRHWEGWGTEQ